MYCSSVNLFRLDNRLNNSPPGQNSSTKNSFLSFWNEPNIFTMKGCDVSIKTFRSVIILSVYFFFSTCVFFKIFIAQILPESFFLTRTTLAQDPFPTTLSIVKSSIVKDFFTSSFYCSSMSILRLKFKLILAFINFRLISHKQTKKMQKDVLFQIYSSLVTSATF